ncbi:MAG: right-handed parallel beta-helix repeat-containing protein [Candidatus Hodarchaeota archaeon]
MRTSISIPITSLLFIFVLSTTSLANTYYVSPTGSDNNPGTLSQPWKTIQNASSILLPGDTVYIRGGTYQESVRPTRSGQIGNYIIYAAYPGEKVILNINSGPAVNLRNRDYIIVDGITVEANGTGLWGAVEQAHFNIIRNNEFRNSSGQSHGMCVEDATYNKFINNTLYKHGRYGPGGTDSFRLDQSSRYNLIEGNRFEFGEHSLLRIEGGTYNVVRNNYFQNDWEKNTEINSPGSSVPAYHNVWENNIFATTQVAGDGEDSPGIQFSGSNNIVRFNVFYHNQGGGFRLEAYTGSANEAIYVYDNRIYNNVFYYNQHAGIFINKYHSGTDISGNIFKNNIVYNNRHEESSNRPQQVYFYGVMSYLDDNRFLYNNIIYLNPGSDVVGHRNLGDHPLSWWQSNYPDNFGHNIEVNPQFVNENNYDFRLRSGSPMIDAGGFLTRTVNSGTGNQIHVEDASYFFDGFGIVQGDKVVVGANSPSRINKVSYNGNTITLETEITWNSGDPVSLPYSGSAPDIGAYEFNGGGDEIPPGPPQNLRIRE